MSSFKSLAFGLVVALSGAGGIENVESDEDLVEDEESDVVAEPQAYGVSKSLGGTYRSAMGYYTTNCTQSGFFTNGFIIAKFNTGVTIQDNNFPTPYGIGGKSNIGAATTYQSNGNGGSIRVWANTGFSGSSKCIAM